MEQFTYMITNPIGIHARPAALLVEAVKGLGSTVSLYKGAKSTIIRGMMSILLLEVCHGDTVTVTVEGVTEQADTLALQSFFQAHL